MNKSGMPKGKNTGGELVMFRVLDKVLKGYNYINHGYYSNLMSPKGSPMQLDRYYPTLKLAFEFDGKQHFEYSKFIHGSEENFEYYKHCDSLKEKMCKEQGITLVRIAYNFRINEDSIKRDIRKVNWNLFDFLFSK